MGLGAIYSVTFVKLTAPFLVYYKSYITFTLSGFLFDQSNVCRDFSILETLVIQCIPLPRKIYKQTRIIIDYVVVHELCHVHISGPGLAQGAAESR